MICIWHINCNNQTNSSTPGPSEVAVCLDVFCYAEDTVANLNQVFQLYNTEMKNELAGSTAIFQKYQSQVFGPLFALFGNNTHFLKELNGQTYLPNGHGVGQRHK